MVKSFKIILFTAVVCALMVGCSSDKCQIITHPSTMKPNDTISVVLASFYVLGNPNSNKVADNVARDSFHLLAGIPQGWDVQTASFYAAKDFNVATVLRSPTSSSSLVADTVPSYLSKVTPMAIDTVLSKAFLSRTISSHDITNKVNISVNTSTINKWAGFSAPIDISIPANSNLDTVLSVDSLVNLMGKNGIDTNSIRTYTTPFNIKTVGFKIIPIVAVLKLRTGAESLGDTLYYYTKTARVQASDASALTDKGDMTFVPISVTSVAVKQGIKQYRQGTFSILTNHSGLKVYFDNSDRHQVITVYSLCGEMVQKINVNNGYAFWNGADRSGKQVPSGSYLAKIADGKAVYSQLVSMTK